MQLVRDKIQTERLVYSMDAQPSASDADSPPSGTTWKYLGLIAVAIIVSTAVIVVGRHLLNPPSQLDTKKFIKARTETLAATRGSNAAPAPVVIALSTDMVRVTAIALGHPRLAVINDVTVAEGDSVTVQQPNSKTGLILRVVRIEDGWIDLSDGTKTFSARLTIPSPPRLKPL